MQTCITLYKHFLKYSYLSNANSKSSILYMNIAQKNVQILNMILSYMLVIFKIVFMVHTQLVLFFSIPIYITYVSSSCFFIHKENKHKIKKQSIIWLRFIWFIGHTSCTQAMGPALRPSAIEYFPAGAAHGHYAIKNPAAEKN